MQAYDRILILFVTTTGFSLGSCAFGFGGGEKALLSDIKVLTLHEGQMTQGRRSSPVPQLECVDKGTASCYSYRPRVVQCTNRGSDGFDIQWECKSDMDKEFKFGWLEVSCEGYDYPDDPYVLKGSCGLRYSLDYTHGSGNNYYEYQPQYKSTLSNRIADLIVYIAIAIAIYVFYVTCCRSSNHYGQTAYSPTDDDYPNDDSRYQGRPGGGGYGWFGGNNSHHGYRDDASCRNNRYRPGGGGGGGGFWTGAATGGFLGYMLGNRWGGGNRYGGYGGYQPGYNANRWHSSGGYGGGHSSTHTSTGFGGTSRR